MDTLTVDLALLERWLVGWSMARGLPLPRHAGGGLVVDVGMPDQLRRHVFVDAGAALQACAAAIDEPLVYLKAAVDCDELRRALPARWQIEAPRWLMACDAPMAAAAAPGYSIAASVEHGGSVLRFVDADGAVAASGVLVMNGATAIFDRIGTAPAHRRRGLGRALMGALDALAREAGATERLLVATEAGRALYLQLGWRVLARYATAVLAAPPFGELVENGLSWRHGAANGTALPVAFRTMSETP